MSNSPRGRSPRSRSRGRDKSRKGGCFECGKDGHIAKYCPAKNGDDRRGNGRDRDRDRGGARGGGGGGERSRDCYNCGRSGTTLYNIKLQIFF